MGMGKGVIAPNKDNIREITKNGYPALFKADDWDDMATTILKYAQSKQNAKQLGEQAKHIIHDNKYFWVANARRTLALLNSN